MAIETKAVYTNAATPGRKTGILWVLGAVFFWSTTGPLIELLGRNFQLKPTELSLWRTFMIAALLAPWVWRNEGWRGFALSRREFILYAVNGVIGIAVFNVAWSGSVQVNGTAVASALIYCAPVFVALGGLFFLKERVGLDKGLAILVNIFGCLLVTGAYNPEVLFRSLEGILLGIGSGFTFAVYTLLGKVSGRREPRSAASILFYLFFFGFVALLPWSLIQEGSAVFSPSLNLWGWLILALLAFGPTLGGYIFFNRALKYLPAAVASLFTTLELPLAAMQALILFNRGLNLIQWLGALLIIGAVVALQFREVRASLKRRAGTE